MLSICPYCGCGCRLNYIVEKNKLAKIVPDPSDEVSEGKPCIKGLTVHEVFKKGRILKPLIRKSKNSKLKEVSWEKAYQFIYKKTKDLTSEEIFFGPSGKITNEDNYIIQKFARIVFKTNNIDACCSRLCHVATVKALINAFGNGGNPWKMEEIYGIDCLLIIGSNPASNYPVLFNKILKIKNKAKIISIQNIASLISEYADFSIIIKPGTETALLNGIINSLIESKKYRKDVENIDGFSGLNKIVKHYTPENVCKLCGIKIDEFKNLVNVIGKSNSFGAIHGMGLTQHVNAIENVHSLLNLIILKNGKLLSCRGEINVQGAGDMSCSPDILPTGSFIEFEKIEKFWNTKVPKERGKSSIEAFLISPVKAAFVSGFNPAQSLPNLNEVHKNLKKMFFVQLDSYYNLTSKFADVILPTPLLFERNGTITNGERRVRLVRKVIKIGNSKPEWVIFKELSKIFGYEKYFEYKNEREITKEIVNIIPAYRKIDVESIYNGNDEWADKEIKFVRLNPEEFEGIEDVRSEKYPFILTTFRSRYHFLTDEMTSKSKTLKKFPEGPFCYLNEEDAKNLKIKNGDRVKISSYVSNIKARVKIDKRIPKGIVGTHFHFENLLVNKLFPTQFDEETFTPNYKIIAVKIEKI